MESPVYESTRIPKAVKFIGNFTGGATPVVDDGGSGTIASVVQASTGKYTITFKPDQRPQHATDIQWSISSKDDGTDVKLHMLIESYTPSTGVLVVWFYANTQLTGVGASATLTADTNANMADGDTVTLNSGFGAPVVYEYDKSANGVAAGHVAVTAGTTAPTVAANFRTAILANQTALSVTDNGDGTLTIVNRWPGAGGNNTNSKSSASALAITNFTGGLTQNGAPILTNPDAGTTIYLSLTGSEVK